MSAWRSAIYILISWTCIVYRRKCKDLAPQRLHSSDISRLTAEADACRSGVNEYSARYLDRERERKSREQSIISNDRELAVHGKDRMAIMSRVRLINSKKCGQDDYLNWRRSYRMNGQYQLARPVSTGRITWPGFTSLHGTCAQRQKCQDIWQVNRTER